MFADHEIIIDKLRSCQEELKHTMLNSLMCLDFYRDLDCFLSEHRFTHAGNREVQAMIAEMDKLMQMHGLLSLEFDTERVSQLVESVDSYVKAKEIEKKILEINLNA